MDRSLQEVSRSIPTLAIDRSLTQGLKILGEKLALQPLRLGEREAAGVIRRIVYSGIDMRIESATRPRLA